MNEEPDWNRRIPGVPEMISESYLLKYSLSFTIIG